MLYKRGLELQELGENDVDLCLAFVSLKELVAAKRLKVDRFLCMPTVVRSSSVEQNLCEYLFLVSLLACVRLIL